MVPASQTGMGPDGAYIPILQRGATFNTEAGMNFVLTENVDFADPSNPTIVAQVDEGSGAPTFYAIKAYGPVVSGQFAQETVPVGDFQKFRKVTLAEPNIAEIISVTDRDGNEYYEVDYLSQEIIYRELANDNYKNDNVPSIMRPFLVSRKYTVTRTGSIVTLQLEVAEAARLTLLQNPRSGHERFWKKLCSDTTFDPSRISKNESLELYQKTQL